jgi:hypothetical protein
MTSRRRDEVEAVCDRLSIRTKRLASRRCIRNSNWRKRHERSQAKRHEGSQALRPGRWDALIVELNDRQLIAKLFASRPRDAEFVTQSPYTKTSSRQSADLVW